MQFTMQVKMTNSEMRTPNDLKPLLVDVSKMLGDYRSRGHVLDVNGNTVGQFEVIGDDEHEFDKALVTREELEDLQRYVNGGSLVSAKALLGKLVGGIQS